MASPLGPKSCFIALYFRGSGEATEEIAPTLRARHPGLLVARAKSRFCQSDGAVNMGAGLNRIGFVDAGQRFLLFGGGRVDCGGSVDVPFRPEAEQYVPDISSHFGFALDEEWRRQ